MSCASGCQPTSHAKASAAIPAAVASNIRSLRVRGAPAIGIAAAMGVVLGVRGAKAQSFTQFRSELGRVTDYLRTSRPTACLKNRSVTVLVA